MLKRFALKGLSDVCQLKKGGNKVFPPPSSPCKVVLLPKLPEENNKHANFEWRGGGRAVDCFVLRSYPIKGQCLNSFVTGSSHLSSRPS